MLNEIEEIIKNSPDPVLIEKAFEFAKKSHKDQKRLSGENYISHTQRVAAILNELSPDSTTIAAALLHDVLDNKPLSLRGIMLKEIEKNLGKEVAFLVEKVSELDKIHYPLTGIKQKERPRITKEKEENLKRMFFALSGDLRAILIGLASRLDNLDTLDYLSAEQKKFYAIETLKIFVPVADRLGIEKIKTRLEDLSFFYLHPKQFEWLRNIVQKKHSEKEKYLSKLVLSLKDILKSEGVEALDVNYRIKSYWSTYQKLLEYNMDLEKIHDFIALRIIVNNVENCYKVLGIIHNHWEPISDEIEDYIAKPKPNNYRSLHTAVFDDRGEIIEIQIRTPEMHKEAEYGVCAHWAYKERVDLKKQRKYFSWVEKIPDFWKSFKIDFFEKRVFVFTPKGDVVNLSKGSTPVDFAYAVHSDVGNHCELAKVNGKVVPLSEPLKNGDVVEIITNPQKTPSSDWLKFVKTKLARSSIKKGAKKTGSPLKFLLSPFKKIALFRKKTPAAPERPEKEIGAPIIFLAGEKGILVNIAKCCSPQTGDEVGAYITKYRGASLHKISCKNFRELSKKFPHKIIEASWK